MRLKKLIPRAIRKRWKKLFRHDRPPRTVAPDGQVTFGPSRLLSMEPPVFLCGIPYKTYLGIAGPFAQRFGNMACGFLVFPTWSIDNPHTPTALWRTFTDHCARYPSHRFLFICNTPREARPLEELGVPAAFINKNIMVSERTFRPVPGSAVEFDAVYNARFVKLKRHELTAAIPRVGYVAYVEEPACNQEFKDLYAETLRRNPDHVLLNKMADGLPIGMSKEQVNAALSHAAVGLVLSEVEGSSYAAIEYLLAGLPVVSTPSKGGRDVYFDPDYCIVCPPDPASVRDAVAALRGRNIPREVIRARTLAKIEPDRRRFLAAVDDLIEQLGGARRYAGRDWPFADVSGVQWRRFEDHLDAFAAKRQAARGAARAGA